MKGAACRDCRFYAPREGFRPAQGECRRYAPHPRTVLTGDDGSINWPVVAPTTWCGQFDPSSASLAGRTP